MKIFYSNFTEKIMNLISWWSNKILQKTLEIAQHYPFEFSVNLSAEDISSTEDREEIIRLLTQHRDLCGRLIFEILESEEIKDYEVTTEFISTVKGLECRIAIDDFGSGYSNFEKILLLDIDMLKVDGSLIRRIDRDRHSELIVRTILDFARLAGWETIAEFVHSKAVYDKVVGMGFDYIQGYYVGKPSPDLQKHLQSEKY
jgi:EAL domain-containing protein (putative c-di-GMP-specific phosphodiesterase class I)